MKKNTTPVYYGDYLQLDKILSAQELQSEKYATAAHEETLFIIVHQAYELWFKQMLHELNTVLDVFAQPAVEDHQLSTVVHRLNRVIKIQKLLNDQISIMETMTPQEFLSFRDYLVPASGFQSIQFKMLEIKLGLKTQYRIDFDKQSFYQRLEEKDRLFLQNMETKDSLFELVNAWLERLPLLDFEDFKFWQLYQNATKAMLQSDQEIIEQNETLTPDEKQKELAELAKTEASFNAVFDAKSFQSLMDEGHFRLSQKALMSALFIHQYCEEPVFNLPFQFLTCLTEIDENLTLWRYRHAMMVQRMLGTKIGTGGSSGHDYLKKTTESNRIFKDFFNMSTFLLPKEVLPALPVNVKKNLGFSLSSV